MCVSVGTSLLFLLVTNTAHGSCSNSSAVEVVVRVRLAATDKAVNGYAVSETDFFEGRSVNPAPFGTKCYSK